MIRLCASYHSRGGVLPLSHQQRELYQQQISYMGSAGLRGRTGPSRTSASPSTPALTRPLFRSAGLCLGARAGDPDLPGSGGHHRPAPVRGQGGRGDAHRFWRRRQDDHRRLPGDRRLHRYPRITQVVGGARELGSSAHPLMTGALLLLQLLFSSNNTVIHRQLILLLLLQLLAWASTPKAASVCLGTRWTSWTCSSSHRWSPG